MIRVDVEVEVALGLDGLKRAAFLLHAVLITISSDLYNRSLWLWRKSRRVTGDEESVWWW